MKRKKANSNYYTKRCPKHMVQRMAFKGTIAILHFAIKE
jgi:hypothetical protein